MDALEVALRQHSAELTKETSEGDFTWQRGATLAVVNVAMFAAYGFLMKFHFDVSVEHGSDWGLQKSLIDRLSILPTIANILAFSGLIFSLSSTYAVANLWRGTDRHKALLFVIERRIYGLSRAFFPDPARNKYSDVFRCRNGGRFRKPFIGKWLMLVALNQPHHLLSAIGWFVLLDIGMNWRLVDGLLKLLSAGK